MVKVTVCGAAGGIGQPLSLLLKLNPQVSELSLFDVVNVPGVGADLSHINSGAVTKSFLPSSKEDTTALAEALKGSDLVVIPAGVPRKPGMTRDDLFNINASIVQSLAKGIAENAPHAFVLVISNPVNSTVPIVAETLKKYNVFNPSKLFGVTTLDIVRANTFISQLFPSETKPTDFEVPVVGGHSGETIVPLYSLGAKSYYDKLSDEQKKELVHRVQFGGDEVVQAKNGAGSATLSMAYAGYRLAESLLKALSGSSVTECTFLYLDSSIKGADEAKKLVKGLDFFSLPSTLGKGGISSVDYTVLEKANSEEKKLLEVAIEQLKGNIAKGVSFGK
ncbi:putative malate dehydrogenase [Clavispora lusitaniae]|uniref:Malate dehydrogenase n=2 Tax=Clavispora lusitaniae TaxID=36911 RepID=A0AA91Q2P0_CLALS|nr:putative malate dehydrogenase [Clavispora lusitaniae]QFZ29244.1 putative malate dehydrogenase [Clavispora lusitaniae]QFZ34907.1 putative malate dehydrogenase [Clavispora lusitaniae]QFZ40592.1 putative malate dehydrogenase [Clavispora lusitaniae]QFZ46272.1 putative malate dehydrogenase [Clavispora lusitaniae]